MTPGYSPADIGVLGIKLDQVYYGMHVLVLHGAYGDVAVGDTIIVWGAYDGGDGACRVGTDGWGIGDTLFGAFHVSDLAGNIFPGWPPDLEQPGSYMTNSCGTFYLGYEQGSVVGPIAPGVGTSTIEDMSQYFAGCPTAIDPVLEQGHLQVIVIGPFDHSGISPALVDSDYPLQLLDMTGAVVYLPSHGAGPILLPELPNGQYILRSMSPNPDKALVRIQYERRAR